MSPIDIVIWRYSNHLVKVENGGKYSEKTRPCTKDIWLSLSDLRKILLQMFGDLNSKSDMLGPSIVAFSRYERTHPNFVSQAPETEIFWIAIGPPL